VVQTTLAEYMLFVAVLVFSEATTVRVSVTGTTAALSQNSTPSSDRIFVHPPRHLHEVLTQLLLANLQLLAQAFQTHPVTCEYCPFFSLRRIRYG